MWLINISTVNTRSRAAYSAFVFLYGDFLQATYDTIASGYIKQQQQNISVRKKLHFVNFHAACVHNPVVQLKKRFTETFVNDHFDL